VNDEESLESTDTSTSSRHLYLNIAPLITPISTSLILASVTTNHLPSHSTSPHSLWPTAYVSIDHFFIFFPHLKHPIPTANMFPDEPRTTHKVIQAHWLVNLVTLHPLVRRLYISIYNILDSLETLGALHLIHAVPGSLSKHDIYPTEYCPGVSSLVKDYAKSFNIAALSDIKKQLIEAFRRWAKETKRMDNIMAYFKHSDRNAHQALMERGGFLEIDAEAEMVLSDIYVIVDYRCLYLGWKNLMWNLEKYCGWTPDGFRFSENKTATPTIKSPGTLIRIKTRLDLGQRRRI
jgi:hypothetical protein